MTLLALSRSIGPLIDDAIVRENIVRHARMGKGTLPGGGGRHRRNRPGSCWPPTLTVVAVFAVGFMGGIAKVFSSEFGLTDATVAVLIHCWWTLPSTRCCRRSGTTRRRGRRARPPGRRWRALKRGWTARPNATPARWPGRWPTAKPHWPPPARCLSAACCWRPWWAASLCQERHRQIHRQIQDRAGSSLEYTEAKAREVEALLRRQPEIKDVYSNIGGGLPPGQIRSHLRVFTTPRPSVNAACLPCLPPSAGDITQLAGVQLESIEAEGGPGGGGKPVRVGIRGRLCHPGRHRQPAARQAGRHPACQRCGIQL